MSRFETFLNIINEEVLEEAEIKYVKGTDLTPEQQKEVKAKFVHRYTGNNKPEWTKQTWKDGKPYPLHFKDDADWLANTTFAVTKTGKLHGGTKYCNSSPTYPNNPELRKTVKEDINEGIVYEEVGKKIIDFLFLKTDKDGRVKTSWGTKTPEGLAKSMAEVMKGDV